MTILKKLLPVGICLCLTIAGKPQSKLEIEEIYRDANSYFYFEDYEEALTLYLQVYSHQPENYNLCYRIGFCYLNIPGSKKNAIPYLEKAAGNITRFYREESILETKAPPDAIFYLGNAYLVNNQVENAIKEYEKFWTLTRGKGSWNFDYLNHQMATAKSSIQLQKNKVNFILTNLGEPVNDHFPNFNATISGNGTTLAYTSRLKFYNAIMVAQLNERGEWEKPINITLDLQVDGRCETLSLSYRGDELYLFRDDNHDGNIYVSHLENGRWTPIRKLNPNINSEYYETHACLSPDGKDLYLSSNRKGGFGDLDIYVSHRESGDNWEVPQNLGSTINTKLNENTPFLTSDGLSLYFSSEGHSNMGGYDIFVSQLEADGRWTAPINLGYPINTTDDDLFFFPIDDGSSALMAMFDPEGMGSQDIYELKLFVPRFMRGIVSTTEVSDRISDKTFNRLVVDTISFRGKALVDLTSSDIPQIIDPKLKSKLVFDGRKFDISQKISYTQTRLPKAEQGENTGFQLTDARVRPNLSQPFKTFADTGMGISKLMGDTNKLISGYTKPDRIRGRSSQLTPDGYAGTNVETYSYLMETLLLLTPPNLQSVLSPILKNNWQFPDNTLSESILNFSSAFKTYEGRDAMVRALANLSDVISDKTSGNTSQRRQTIASDSEYGSFTYFYNQLINLSSPNLAKQLAAITVGHPKINTFSALLAAYKKANPKGYRENLPELLRVFSRISISAYNALPDEDKINLYSDITQDVTSGKRNVWYFYLLLFLVVALAGYLLFRYLKLRKESQS